MSTDTLKTLEPPAEILTAARAWLDPVRAALGDEFLAAYLTGSVLSSAFDARHSRVNVLVVSRSLDMSRLDTLASRLPRPKKPAFDPLFVTMHQIRHSLDVFPIEWLDLKERHLRLEGDDVFAALEVPLQALRLQCERELRGKHIRLREAYVLGHGHADHLTAVLRSTASGMATLFRTLLRLRGETPPADTPRVIERLADLYRLNATALLGPHVVRYSHQRPKFEVVQALYRGFLTELDRLIAAVDEMRVA
ncbi:MAG: hypothetical protein ACRENS_10610 [Candidatus Eiseniibacteriota bacterium]